MNKKLAWDFSLIRLIGMGFEITTLIWGRAGRTLTIVHRYKVYLSNPRKNSVHEIIKLNKLSRLLRFAKLAS